MKNKIVWVVVSCLMVLSLVMASCGPTDVEEEEEEEEVVIEEEEEEEVEEEVEEQELLPADVPKYGGIYTTLGGDPMGFDEAYTMTMMCWTLRLTNEELLMGDWTKGPAGTGEYDWFTGYLGQLNAETGCLAESWDMPDDETIVFHLRKGVHWHNKPPVNGRELTADDVVFSIDRTWTSPQSFLYSSNPPQDRLISVKAIDKYTVECKVPAHMQGPSLFLTGDQLKIIPPEVVQTYGDLKDWRNAYGTGPWILTDYVTSSLITFEKHPDYWQYDPLHPENQLPYMDGMKFLIIPDSSTQLASIRTGKIDAASGLRLTWDNLESLMQTAPGLTYIRTTGSHLALWGRMDKPELPFDDLRVRQALNMAINKQEIVDDYYGGRADLCAPIYPLTKSYEAFNTPFEELPETAQELFSYNPEKARQLLAEAGYPDGFKTEIACTFTDADYLSIIREYLLKVGVDMQITPYESGVFFSMMRGRTYNEMIFKESTSRGFPYKMNEVRIENPDDVAFYEHERTRAAYNEISLYVGKDDAKWTKLLHDIYPFIIEQAVGVWLPVPYVYRVWWPWFQNYRGEFNVGYDNTYAYTQYAWIDEALKKSMGY